MLLVHEKLLVQATSTLPQAHPQLGDQAAIDGTLIDAVSSMTWADYSSITQKAGIHLGFDINRGIPGKVCLTDGKGDERPLVPRRPSPGQTGVMNRNFDLWQEEVLPLVCRIKAAAQVEPPLPPTKNARKPANRPPGVPRTPTTHC